MRPAAIAEERGPSVSALVRDVPDFPQPGILFKDITPVLQSPRALRDITEWIGAVAEEWSAEVIVGIESRGFVFGAAAALELGLPFVPVRKVGKLPAATLREDYDLEYGTNAVEIHEDAVRPGQRVIIIDDLLATGGTASAASRLVERLGGQVVGCAFVLELGFLPGRAALESRPVESMIRYS